MYRKQINLEKEKLEDSDYVPYTYIISDIIDKYVESQLQESAGFITPKLEYSTAAEILGFRDGIELFNRRLSSGKMIMNKKNGKISTREEKINLMIKFLKNINEVDIRTNKIVKIKPFFDCQKCCKRCVIGA